VPELKPFRALRYDAGAVGDLSDVVSPPYDVISPARQRELARRHPRNVVRLDLPLDEAGDAPDDRYRRAARDLAAWRSDGTLRKDRLPSVYAYEEAYSVPGSSEQRVQRGFFARLRVEEYGPGSGVRPHERTLSAPKEDRYRLLRATGINASPVVLLFADADGAAAQATESASRLDPTSDVIDDDGVRHRLWQLPAEDPALGPLAQALIGAGSAAPLTIADGHHRYETALRYHDERHRDRQLCELAPFDYLLALLVSADQPLTVLPTHRVVRDGPAGEELVTAASALFDVQRLASRAALATAFAGETTDAASRVADVAPAERRHRVGLWTGGIAAVLVARRAAFEPLLDPSASPALRWSDVNLLAVALERWLGIDRSATAGGGRITYTKDATEALDLVDRGEATAAFLLDPTPVDDVLRVAAAGEVMPQKSTYFYPKQLTGLVMNPHEW
jgi:uncharacterized protein (DUF1015 family)